MYNIIWSIKPFHHRSVSVRKELTFMCCYQYSLAIQKMLSSVQCCSLTWKANLKPKQLILLLQSTIHSESYFDVSTFSLRRIPTKLTKLYLILCECAEDLKVSVCYIYPTCQTIIVVILYQLLNTYDMLRSMNYFNYCGTTLQPVQLEFHSIKKRIN